MVAVSFILALSASLAGLTTAHPGHDLSAEIAERSAFLKNNKRDLSHCAEKLKARGVEEKALKRRQASIDQARVKRSLHPKRHIKLRDTDTILNTSHLSSLNVTSGSGGPGVWGVEDTIFGNSSCVLSPEGEVGPYYVTGEFVRSDVREGQEGFDVIIDGQFIDINTCDPVPDLYWDLWHCNSTGVYGGVVSSGNGNSDDAANINATFLRGIQPTDGDGVAQFQTIFPGHYSGRATHIHIVAHANSTVLSNGTLTDGSITHIGQLFFDQDLITEVNALGPYLSNTIAITTNADDRVFAAETETDSDPVIDYVLLGDTVADGIFAWISMGVDTTASYTYTAASNYGANGGVTVSSSTTTTGGGNSTGGGNGTMGGGNSTGGGNGTMGGDAPSNSTSA